MKGYFRKRGSKWSFSVDVGKDENGKRKQKTVSGFKTKKEAEKACAELITEIENGEYMEESNDSFEAVALNWLEIISKPNVRETTYSGYKHIIEGRLIDCFKKKKIVDIKPIDLQKYYADLLGEGLKPGYITRIHTVLRGIFNSAKMWQIIKSNPMEIVKAPKNNTSAFHSWTIDQARTFLDHLYSVDKKLYIFALLAIYTGMRSGEILGLKWSDVSFDTRKIHLKGNLVYINKVGFRFHEGKTKSSNRTISIPDTVVADLRKYKTDQNKIRLSYGPEYKDHDLIVCAKDGNPLFDEPISLRLKTIMKEIGVPVIRVHDFRHTHATIMLKLGEHPKVVSERLGHSNIQMTLNRYSHVTIDMQEEASDRFESAMNTLTK